MNIRLSVITRASNNRDNKLLLRAMLSVHTSEYKDIEHIVITKNLSDSKITNLYSEIEQFLPKIYGVKRSFLIKNINYGNRDSRTVALNLGVQNASGKFLSFLDHDDLIYPSAYGKAISELENSSADLVIGRIKKVSCGISNQMFYVQEKKIMDFPQHELAILKDNIIPIHGFIINRENIKDKVKFNTKLTALEDYHFLINIVLENKVKFIDHVFGEYWFYPDNRNTTSGLLSNNPKFKSQWEKSRALVNKFKNEHKFLLTAKNISDMVDAMPFSEIIEQKNIEINNQKININKYQVSVKQFESNYSKNLLKLINIIQKYPEGLGDLVINIYRNNDVEYVDAQTKILRIEFATFINGDRASHLDISKVTDKHVRIALPKNLDKAVHDVALTLTDGHISFVHKVFKNS